MNIVERKEIITRQLIETMSSFETLTEYNSVLISKYQGTIDSGMLFRILYNEIDGLVQFPGATLVNINRRWHTTIDMKDGVDVLKLVNFYNQELLYINEISDQDEHDIRFYPESFLKRLKASCYL